MNAMNAAFRPALLAASSLLLAGCSLLEPKADLTRFYLLRPAPAAATEPAADQTVHRSSFRVGPGRVAAYLDESEIIQTEGANRVRPLALHHWAEPLAKGVERVLIEQLQARMPRAVVLPAHDPGAPQAHFQLVYDVTRLDGAQGGDVVLEATWNIRNQNASGSSPRQTSRIVVPAAGGAESVDAYVARLSEAVLRWSAEIASASHLD